MVHLVETWLALLEFLVWNRCTRPKSKRQLLFGISRGSSLYFGVAFEVDGVPLVQLLAARDFFNMERNWMLVSINVWHVQPNRLQKQDNHQKNPKTNKSNCLSTQTSKRKSWWHGQIVFFWRIWRTKNSISCDDGDDWSPFTSTTVRHSKATYEIVVGEKVSNGLIFPLALNVIETTAITQLKREESWALNRSESLRNDGWCEF